MAKVRCSCGRQYDVSEGHLGKQVKCGACGRLFVAEAAGASQGTVAAGPEKPATSPRTGTSTTRSAEAVPPKAPAKERPKAPAHRQHLGELAVARGYITRKQLDACLEYQKALATIPHGDDRRLGDILAKMRLLTRAQLESLLGEQSEDLADAIAQVAAGIPRAERPTPKHAVSEDRLAAIRESVRVAAKNQEAVAKVVAQAAVRHRSGAIQQKGWRLRPLYFVAAGAAVLVLFLLWWIVPSPQPQRVLAAYLQSCNESSVQPDASQALVDLGIVVREFDPLQCQRAVTHDFGPDLKAVAAASKEPTWGDVLALPDLPSNRRRALELLLPGLPDDVTPVSINKLEITVCPVTAKLTWRRRGAASFFGGELRFFVLRASSPLWKCGWRVAGYDRGEDVEASAPAS
jgi:hypothetical protein